MIKRNLKHWKTCRKIVKIYQFHRWFNKKIVL